MQAKKVRNGPVSNQAPEEAPGNSTEERNLRIAEGAYFRAAQRGFVGGDPMQDWLDAEQEIDLERHGA